MPEPAGVCWNDISSFTADSCNSCVDGDVCVHRSPLELLCVPFAVCASLAQLGAASACRYADKTPFTGAPIANDPGCPGGLQHVLCGGGCGACHPPSHSGPYRCVGRSATRPHGICVLEYQLLPCSYAANGTPIEACPDTWYCAVFKAAPPDDVTAKRFGTCLLAQDCVADAPAEGLLCLDKNGSNQAP